MTDTHRFSGKGDFPGPSSDQSSTPFHPSGPQISQLYIKGSNKKISVSWAHSLRF